MSPSMKYHRQDMRVETRATAKKFMAILSAAAALLLLYVWQHIQAVRFGYEVHALQQEIAHEENTNNILRVKISRLASLSRLDELAKTKLGLVLPGKDDIVMVSIQEDGTAAPEIQQASLPEQFRDTH